MKWIWTRQYTIGEQIPGVLATTTHSLELPTDPFAFDPTLAKQGAIAAPSSSGHKPSVDHLFCSDF